MKASRLRRRSHALAVAAALLTPGGAPAARRDGLTVDVPYDASLVAQRADEAYVARLFVPAEVVAAPRAAVALPLVVFLHGVNTDHRKFRFAGHGGEPDVREIVGRLVTEGVVPPVVVGAPSSVVSCDYPRSLWPAFDLDRFVFDAARTLRGTLALDLERIIVVAHSGAACNPRGGVLSAVSDTTLALRGVVLIDTCLDVPNVPLLVGLPPGVDVVVSYQTRGWPRSYDAFGEAFLGARRARGGGLRDALTVFERRSPPAAHPHNAMVEEVLRAWLPRLLRADPPPGGARTAP